MGHRGLGCLGPEAIDEGLEPVDLLGLPLGGLGQTHLILGAVGKVLRVGALVLLHRAEAGIVVAVEMEHACDGFIQKLEVVADHQ